jgi:hypothetical protein
MAPEHKNSDAGVASNTKRSCDVLSISEKVKILDMIEIEKNCMGNCQVVWEEKSSIREVIEE